MANFFKDNWRKENIRTGKWQSNENNEWIICPGELLVHVEQFEKTLVINIVEANNQLSSSNGGVFKRNKNLLLNSSGRTELDNLIASLQQGLQSI